MNKVPTERAKFWQQHIEAAKSFAGTGQQYCDEHELEASSFYQSFTCVVVFQNETNRELAHVADNAFFEFLQVIQFSVK